MKSTAFNLQPQDSFASEPEDAGLKRALVISIAVHVGLVAAFTVRTFFFPSEPIRLEHSIRVDIVGLPDKPTAKLPPAPEPAKVETKPEPPKPELPKPAAEPAKPQLPKPVAAPPKPETPKVNLEKSRQDQQAALKRLEALEKLKNISSNKPSQQDAAQTAPSKPVPVSQVKGNEVSAGSALKGLARLQNENYTEALLQHVTRHWNLPGWMASANLKATVQLYIDAQGSVLKKVMTNSSGNPVFDERVMRAIEDATPLPRPPSDLANLVAVRGIEIEFTPEK